MIAVLAQTFRDLYRERILYNVFFLALFLLFVGYLASLLVFGHQDRVMIHFGTSTVSVSMIAVALTVGARLIRAETEQRLIYLPLSRPISRGKYFLGKALGVTTFLACNLLFLTLILVGAIYYTGGEYRPVLLQWVALTLLESVMVLGLSLTLSFWLRPGLTAMCSLTFLFLSHNHEQMSLIQKQAEHGGRLFKLLSHLTPDGSIFFLDTRIYYDQPLSVEDLALRFGYGLLWALAFMLVANAIFHRRNL